MNYFLYLWEEQTYGYQRAEGRGEGQIKGMGLTGTNYHI